MNSKRCREEIDQVLGSKTTIDYEDITKMKYIGCVFKESLRLFPPATELFRFVPEDREINGLKIPKRTPYTVNLSSFHFTFCETIKLMLLINNNYDHLVINIRLRTFGEQFPELP